MTDLLHGGFAPFYKYLIVFFSSVLAGITNAVAGGGTLITFPSLIFVGVNPISANITNTIALWIGSLTGAIGFRDSLKDQKDKIKLLMFPSLFGGLTGAYLLVSTPTRVFESVVPFLILFATLTLLFKRRMNTFFRSYEAKKLYVLPLQFFIAMYGGYFGAGIGILMLAGLGLMGVESIHVANGIKNLMGFTINATASLFFLSSGYILWDYALVMMLGFGAGGYLGAIVSTKIDKKKVELFTVLWGFVLSVVFFIRVG